MRVVIVGGGIVGTRLARHLIDDGNEVSLVEADEERARRASNHLDCLIINDEGNNTRVLEDAGIARADALVAVTRCDEVNMITCALAEAHYPDVLKIARVSNEGYLPRRPVGVPLAAFRDVFAAGGKTLGVDYFVHSNIEASRTALAAIEHNAAGDVLSFAGTDYELGSIEVAAGTPFDGLALKDYRRLVPGNTLVTLIERGDESILPGGETVLHAGDIVYVLAQEDEMDSVFELGSRLSPPVRKIGIAGGGQLGRLIADGLLSDDAAHKTPAATFFSFFRSFIQKRNRSLYIIEQDYEVCRELAAEFPAAVVLNEDISDETFVAEEKLGSLDLIVTTTGNPELNIITALYLKSLGVKRAVVMVGNDGYAKIARRLGIDVVIPVKSVMVDSILSRLAGSGVSSIRRLGNGATSILELTLAGGAPCVGETIVAFRAVGALLLLVERGGQSFIPHGDYVFQEDDKVVVLLKKEDGNAVERFFAVNL
jgi:trk system potassium uptake protein TrkA